MTYQSTFDAIWAKKFAFCGTFFAIFFTCYGTLAMLDALPEPVATVDFDTTSQVAAVADVLPQPIIPVASSTPTTTDPVILEEPVFPDTIVIDKLDRTITVLNPTSSRTEDLDAALLYGTVRHPASATLDQSGTVFILGHSSYLPTVLNPNFQAFNGIQDLRFGDTIRLQSGSVEYVYRVEKVYRAKASEVTVPIAGDEKRLVIATCNSFGSIDDRYVVEAVLLESKEI